MRVIIAVAQPEEDVEEQRRDVALGAQRACTQNETG